MVIDLSSLNNLLNFMYKDNFSVERLENIQDPRTGLTSQEYKKVDGYENITCKLSFGYTGRSIDNATIPTNNASSNPYSLNPQLFYPLDISLKKGDRVTVNIVGNRGDIIGVVTGICGEPKMYQIYQEVEMSVEEN